MVAGHAFNRNSAGGSHGMGLFSCVLVITQTSPQKFRDRFSFIRHDRAMSTSSASPSSVIETQSPLSTDRIGQWISFVFPGGKGTHRHHSPIDGSLIAEMPESSPADVNTAFDRARAAQKAWAATPLAGRAAIMLRFHDLVLDHQKDLLDAVQWETGKSRASAFDEVADIALTARYYARSAKRHLSSKRRQGIIPLLTSAREHYVPRGVIGMITPWNYPLTLPLSDAIPALVAGNAIVLKPDNQTPLSALSALALLYEAGLPKDLFQVVVGDGPRLGSAIIQNADFVMFTGSTQTGKIVAQQCGERLIGFSAELGGKNPMIVLEDAPMVRAVAGAINASFSNAGQLCMSIERLYVHDALYDRFVPAFVAAVTKMRLGIGLDFSADVGSLISQEQLEKVQGHVHDALKHGATLLAGGHHRPDVGPYVFEPTVLENVTEDMLLCRGETFGPVVAVYRFHSDEEAIRLANDTPYGLNASVWGSTKRARLVAQRIEAGSANVNEGFTASWASTDAPMGGFKESGVGRRHGREGIVKYTNVQTVATQRLINVAAPRGMSAESFSKVMTTGLKIMKYLPFRD
jgi:succinate-semialdehyde dehydrogenase/glutarate-semialdehyde dehydrogenase